MSCPLNPVSLTNRTLPQSGAFLRPSLIPLLVSHLTSPAEDVRAAAAAATASAMEVFPETVPEGLTAMLALYEGESDSDVSHPSAGQ